MVKCGLIIYIICISLSLQAQSFNYGPSLRIIGTQFKPELLNSTLQPNQYKFNTSTQLNIGIGIHAKYTIKQQWHINTGIYTYRQRLTFSHVGFNILKSNENRIETSIIYGVFEIPLTIGYSINLGKKGVAIVPTIGASTTLNRIRIMESDWQLDLTQNNFDSLSMVSTDSIKNFNHHIWGINLVAGIGIHLGKRHQINMMYQYGFTSMHETSYRINETTFNPNSVNIGNIIYTGTFNQFYLSYTYYFNRKRNNKTKT